MMLGARLGAWANGSVPEPYGTCYLESVDGNAIFLLPDGYIGDGHAYKFDLDIHFEFTYDYQWSGIMGFYSPSQSDHTRFYVSKNSANEIEPAIGGDYFNRLSRRDVGEICDPNSHGHIILNVNLLDYSASISFGDRLVNFSRIGTISFTNTKNRMFGIMGTCNYPNHYSMSPSEFTPSMVGTRVYGFREWIDQSPVFDLVPVSDNCFINKVNGEMVFPNQGSVIYGEE